MIIQITTELITQWAGSPGLGESTLRLLETAVGELEHIVGQLQQISSEVDDLSHRLRNVAGIDWYSPAGQAFSERVTETAARTDTIADNAREAALLGAVGIDNLLGSIANARTVLEKAREAVMTMPDVARIASGRYAW